MKRIWQAIVGLVIGGITVLGPGCSSTDKTRTEVPATTPTNQSSGTVAPAQPNSNDPLYLQHNSDYQSPAQGSGSTYSHESHASHSSHESHSSHRSHYSSR
jgi:hypothetical protein